MAGWGNDRFSQKNMYQQGGSSWSDLNSAPQYGSGGSDKNWTYGGQKWEYQKPERQVPWSTAADDDDSMFSQQRPVGFGQQHSLFGNSQQLYNQSQQPPLGWRNTGEFEGPAFRESLLGSGDFGIGRDRMPWNAGNFNRPFSGDHMQNREYDNTERLDNDGRDRRKRRRNRRSKEGGDDRRKRGRAESSRKYGTQEESEGNKEAGWDEGAEEYNYDYDFRGQQEKRNHSHQASRSSIDGRDMYQNMNGYNNWSQIPLSNQPPMWEDERQEKGYMEAEANMYEFNYGNGYEGGYEDPQDYEDAYENSRRRSRRGGRTGTGSDPNDKLIHRKHRTIAQNRDGRDSLLRSIKNVMYALRDASEQMSLDIVAQLNPKQEDRQMEEEGGANEKKGMDSKNDNSKNSTAEPPFEMDNIGNEESKVNPVEMKDNFKEEQSVQEDKEINEECKAKQIEMEDEVKEEQSVEENGKGDMNGEKNEEKAGVEKTEEFIVNPDEVEVNLKEEQSVEEDGKNNEEKAGVEKSEESIVNPVEMEENVEEEKSVKADGKKDIEDKKNEKSLGEEKTETNTEEKTKEKELPPRVLLGVVRTGAAVKRVLSKDATHLGAELVAVFESKPTKQQFLRVGELLKEKMSKNIIDKLVIDVKEDEELISIENKDSPYPLIIRFTSPKYGTIAKQSEEAVPEDALDGKKCIDALTKIRRVRWSSRKARSDMERPLARIFIDMTTRLPGWKALTPYAAEVLVNTVTERICKDTRASEVTMSRIFIQSMEVLAEGLVLPGGPGLKDPCHAEPVDVFAYLEPQMAEDLTKAAQSALRMIACDQMEKLLDIDS